MKHYKASICIHNRITDLQVEIEKLRSIKTESQDYAGYVFIQNDIENINQEIDELTETLKELIKIPEICKN